MRSADEEKKQTTPDEKAAEAVPKRKPYMIFNAGDVVQKSGIPGIQFDFNYGARVTVPQGDYRIKYIDWNAYLAVYAAQISGGGTDYP